MVLTWENLERDVVMGAVVMTEQMLQVPRILAQRLGEAGEPLKTHSRDVVVPTMLTSYVWVWWSPSEQGVCLL